MAKSQEWKDARDAMVPLRKEWARKTLARAGIEVLGETKHSLILKVNCAKVEYFPFTGGYRGKGIPSGRGLKNLIALKEGHSKEKAS